MCANTHRYVEEVCDLVESIIYDCQQVRGGEREMKMIRNMTKISLMMVALMLLVEGISTCR